MGLGAITGFNIFGTDDDDGDVGGSGTVLAGAPCSFEASGLESPSSVGAASDGLQGGARAQAGDVAGHTVSLLFSGSVWASMAADDIEVGKPRTYAGRYRQIRKIAHGTQAAIFEVQCVETGTRYALKETPLLGRVWRRDLPCNIRNVDREARLLAQLREASAVVVELHLCWLRPDYSGANLLTELLAWDMAAVLEQFASVAAASPDGSRYRGLPEEYVCQWLVDLMTAVAVIHDMGYIHRDVKPANVLLTADLRGCKLADMGISRHIIPADGDSEAGVDADGCWIEGGALEPLPPHSARLSSLYYTAAPGTPAYASPESLRGDAYGPKTDVFSLACVLFELLTLERLLLLEKKAGHTLEPGPDGKPRRETSARIAAVTLQERLDSLLSDVSRVQLPPPVPLPPPPPGPDGAPSWNLSGLARGGPPAPRGGIVAVHRELHAACLQMLAFDPGARPDVAGVLRRTPCLVLAHEALLRRASPGFMKLLPLAWRK